MDKSCGAKLHRISSSLANLSEIEAGSNRDIEAAPAAGLAHEFLKLQECGVIL